MLEGCFNHLTLCQLQGRAKKLLSDAIPDHDVRFHVFAVHAIPFYFQRGDASFPVHAGHVLGAIVHYAPAAVHAHAGLDYGGHVGQLLTLLFALIHYCIMLMLQLQLQRNQTALTRPLNKQSSF
jgi:hypothetical protein